MSAALFRETVRLLWLDFEDWLLVYTPLAASVDEDRARPGGAW